MDTPQIEVRAFSIIEKCDQYIDDLENILTPVIVDVEVSKDAKANAVECPLNVQLDCLGDRLARLIRIIKI